MSATIAIQSVGPFATPGGAQRVNVQFTVTTPLGSETEQSLSSGNNSITIPTGATFVIIQFPTGNANTVIVKGVNGDNGVTIGMAGPAIIPVVAGVTTLVLSAGGTINNVTFTWL